MQHLQIQRHSQPQPQSHAPPQSQAMPYAQQQPIQAPAFPPVPFRQIINHSGPQYTHCTNHYHGGNHHFYRKCDY